MSQSSRRARTHVNPEGDITCAGFSPQQIPPNTAAELTVTVNWSVTSSDVSITRRPVFKLQFVNQQGEIVEESGEVRFLSGLFSDSKTLTVTTPPLPTGVYDVRTHHLRTAFPSISLAPIRQRARRASPLTKQAEPDLGRSSCGTLTVGDPQPSDGTQDGTTDGTNGGGTQDGTNGGTEDGTNGGVQDGVSDGAAGGISREQAFLGLLIAAGAAVAIGRR